MLMDERKTFRKSETISYDELLKRWGYARWGSGQGGVTAIELVDIFENNKITIYSKIRERGDSVICIKAEWTDYGTGGMYKDAHTTEEDIARYQLESFFDINSFMPLHDYLFKLSDVASVERAYPDILPDGVQPLILWDDSMDYWACRIFEQIDAAVNNVPTAQPEAVGTQQEGTTPVPTQDEHAYPQPAAIEAQTEEQGTPYVFAPAEQWEAAFAKYERTAPEQYTALRAFHMARVERRQVESRNPEEKTVMGFTGKSKTRTYQLINEGERIAIKEGLYHLHGRE